MTDYELGNVQINMNLTGDNEGLPIILRLDNGQETTGERDEGWRTVFIFKEYVPSPYGATVYWKERGYARLIIPPPGQWEASYPPVGMTDMDFNPINEIVLQPTIPNFTRDQVCGAQVTLSGLMINTNQFGNQPWFELAYQCLNNAADRASVRQQKKDLGDTGIIIEFFTNAGSVYNEQGQWLYHATTPSGEQNPDWFRGLVEEILRDGMIPIVAFDGDGGMNQNDGYPNALRQLPILVDLLHEYNDKVLYARFWDGVFNNTGGGSTPESIQHFGQEFRKLLPNGHLAIEFGVGYIPVGNGPRDYEPGGMMVDYDVIAGEFGWPAPITNPPAIVAAEYDDEHGYTPTWASDASDWLGIWQILGRLVHNYNPPSNQPFNVTVKASNGPQQGQMVTVSSDSHPAPYYLHTGNARGKYFFWAMESGEYQWVRHQASLTEMIQAGNYFRGTNAPNVGLP